MSRSLMRGVGRELVWITWRLQVVVPIGLVFTGHLIERCAWSPAPAAAEAALEQLSKAAHKRPHHMHLVLIPHLMTATRRRMSKKIYDLILFVPIGSDLWGVSQHEPLIVGLCLPLTRHPPWKLRGAGSLDTMPEGVVWPLLHPAR
jgi:hypothetical protein